MNKELKAAFDLIEKSTVSVSDAADFLGVRHGQIIELINRDNIEADASLGMFRIISASLDAYAKSLTERVK